MYKYSFEKCCLWNIKRVVLETLKLSKFCLLPIVNPQKDGGGSNWHIALLKARYDILDAARCVKPSRNFHFWCLWWVTKKKFGGPKEFFSKTLHSKFNFQKIVVQKNFFCNFWENFITKHVLDGKFELRMISAFIWCIYCLCRQKLWIFQNWCIKSRKIF